MLEFLSKNKTEVFWYLHYNTSFELYRCSSIRCCKNDAKLDKSKSYEFFNFCEIMKRQPVIFYSTDNSEIFVQIYESAFWKRQKYTQGKYNSQQGVFGLTQPEKHKCVLTVVEDRIPDTLLSLIKKHLPDTSRVRIVSDERAPYRQLSALGCQHSIIYHTNGIASIWSHVKWRITSMNAVKRESLPNYLDESKWKHKNAETLASCASIKFWKISQNCLKYRV